MGICTHCNGTGVAPIKLKQECIGCQKKVVVTFQTYDDIIKSDGLIYCLDCKKGNGSESN